MIIFIVNSCQFKENVKHQITKQDFSVACNIIIHLLKVNLFYFFYLISVIYSSIYLK